MKYLIIAITILLYSSLCFAEPLSYWQDQASFYESNYPTCSDNEKAMLLYSAMKNTDNFGILLDRKEYKYEVITLYKDGVKIWPVEHLVDPNKPSKSSIANLFIR